MTQMTDPSAAPASPPFWNDPKIRAIVFQVVVTLGVIAVGAYLVRNLMHNLEVRGISTGFGFLANRAGFAINQSLIAYDQSSSYGRTFFVGLLNTLLVSGLGIVLATILGFIIGIARLSRNWLVSRLAAAYIEIFRNIPLLLQILFWYFAVFLNLPAPSEALSIGDAVFLTQRGLYLPQPVAESGFGWTVFAFLAAAVASFFLVRWSRRRQDRTGQLFPAFTVSLALLVLVPINSQSSFDTH